MKIKKFEEIESWQLSLKITKEIYDLTCRGKFAEDVGMRDHLRKPIVAVSSNIVEGFEKNNKAEFIKHLNIAKRSCSEVRNQLYIAFAVDCLEENVFENLNQQLISLSTRIGNLIQDLGKKKKIRKK
jgi:four helix bundle protein